MNIHNYKARKNKQGLNKGLWGFLLLGTGTILLTAFLAPSLTGQFGQIVHHQLFQFSGWSSIIIPLTLCWLGYLRLQK